MLEPIVLRRSQLQGRNCLLGNKQGFMLHLPAASGGTVRTIHRSKWFGASRFGRKFLEAVVYRNQAGELLCRRNQESFLTDGMTVRRTYENGYAEEFFVPDHLHACHWLGEAPAATTADLYLDMRYQRGTNSDHGYLAELEDGYLAVCRTIEMGAGSGAEGVDTGGTAEGAAEMVWAVAAVSGGAMSLNPPPERWRPMWYSLDAARRRYLRKLAQRDVPAVEHAPLWELTSEWVYAPVSISFPGNGGQMYLGFGSSRQAALEACRALEAKAETLRQEKQERLASLLESAAFETGYRAADRAYAHVLSRTIDCLVVEGKKDQSPRLKLKSSRSGESGKARAGHADPLGGGASIMAGDAYFQEAWKRDENIALGGLLASGQYQLCRRIIDSTWQRQDPVTGRLPLRIRAGEIPGYTSSDGTLWALLRLKQYLDSSGDVALFHAKRDMVAHFFDRSILHCRNGLLPSGGVSVREHEWETWMDTEFSSRSGFPVEIQLLWLACLLRFQPLLLEPDTRLARRMARTAAALRRSLELFSRGDYFVDHLDRSLRQVDLFTPNGYFWSILGIDFDWEWEERSLGLGRWELGGVSGVRTLARSQWEMVLGPQIAALARRDRPLPSAGKVNYHRGVEWNWLAQLFVAAHLKHGHPDMAYDHHLARQVFDSVSMAGLGGVSEVFDHRGPAGPDFQAWSMTGLVESLQRFAGVRLDVPSRRIVIAPQKPRRWPFLRARKWYDGNAMDLIFRSTERSRRLEIVFARLPVPAPTLDIRLPIAHERAPRAVQLVDGAGRRRIQGWAHIERPPSIRVELEATVSQTIVVEL